MTDLRETRCRCGVAVMESPRSTVQALCLECRQDDTGAVTVYDPIGEWHPTVDFRDALMIAAPESEPLELPPPPKVTSGDPLPPGLLRPAPVSSLAADGHEAGWWVKVQYSRGYAVKYRGAWQEEELWAVRFDRGPRGAFAVYRSVAGRNAWTWRDVWMWGDDLLPFGQAGATDLQHWLDRKGYPETGWYREIIARRVEQERLKGLRDPFRVQLRKGVDLFPGLCEGLHWPAALMLAVQCAHETWTRAEGIYTPEELSKILSAKHRSGTKAEEAS